MIPGAEAERFWTIIQLLLDKKQITPWGAQQLERLLTEVSW